MVNTWFTSDTHFFHANITKYCHRPFLCPKDQTELDRRGGKWHIGEWKNEYDTYKISQESVKLMNEHLINNINKLVKANDILYILGDFVFGVKDNYVSNACWARSNIICNTVYIIWGNHDNPERIAHLFTDFWDHILIKIHGQKIFLDHYANAIWDKSHRKAWHLYGHSHAEAEEMLDTIMPGRKSMDVGVDNAYRLLGEYRPFSFQEIKSIMDKRPGWVFKKELVNAHLQPEETH